MTVNPNLPLVLSDGTVAEFVKITPKGNIQVRLPDDSYWGEDDPLRIFTPSGDHYKGAMEGVRLENKVATTNFVQTRDASDEFSDEEMDIALALATLIRHGAGIHLNF